MNNHNFKSVFPDVPESFKNKVSFTLNSLPDENKNIKIKNVKTFKNISFKKKVVVTLLATFVLGTTALAGGKVSSIVGSSSNKPVYTVLPNVEQVENDFGFTPKIVKKFDNGYIFKNGYKLECKGKDESGNTVAEKKELEFEYTKNNDKLSLYMEKGMLGERSEKEAVVDKYKDIDIYYSSFDQKCVPENYQMTEQDKQDKINGKYEFSFGGKDKEVEITNYKFLNWEQDGIYYSFMAADSSISQGELVEMAHQIIGQN